MSEFQPKRPVVKYRVELEKKLEINKSYKERRNRAIAIRILSYGLFGQKRFQNLYLSCSLNCFYWALQIANFLHQRVAGLAMIIKFEQVHVIEYYEKQLENGKTYAQQKYTKIVIKLTRSPTDDDKKEPGFNPGYSSESIKDQMTDIIKPRNRDAQRGDRPQRPRRGRGSYRGRGDRERYDRGERAERGERGERNDRYERRDREERDRPERREREERRDDRRRDERRDERRERQDRPIRREGERRQRRERDEQRDDRRVARYGDDRDERRIYKDEGKQGNEKNESSYQRGQPKSRGQSRYHQKEKREQRPRYEAKQESRPQREDRGDRRPKRNHRYSDDED